MKYSKRRLKKSLKLNLKSCDIGQFDRFVWQKKVEGRWHTDHVPVSLCLPKCQPAGTAEFIYLPISQSKLFQNRQRLRAVKQAWPGECQLFIFFFQSVILQPASIPPNFLQWHLCVCPVFPPWCLTECGNDRVIWQLRLPWIPAAIPRQPARGVEHNCSARPPHQALLHPLQLGAL